MHYLYKRLLLTIPLLLGITFLSFILMRLTPGDPTTMFSSPHVSMSDMAQVRENLGLNRPAYMQYFYWLKEILSGNFGYSYMTGKPVLTAILERMPATLLLSTSSLFLILCITFPLGLISGYKKNSLFDHTVTLLSFIGLSIPTFWIGLMFILFFSLTLGWLPSSGFIDPLITPPSMLNTLLSIIRHMYLPLGTLLIGGIAGLTRYHRFGIISILKKPYITAARARSIPEYRLLFTHAFKNAALPIITILGLELPSLISGSFIIEYIFAWPGMGQLGISAVFARDYPIIMGTIFFSSLLIVLGSLLADLAYGFIDPRIKRP